MSVQDDVRAVDRRGREPGPTALGARGDPGDGCRCTVTALRSPAGVVVVLRVDGEIDMSTVGLLETALLGLLAERPGHLIVDLTDMRFCSGRGLTVLIDAAATARAQGTRYAFSGVRPASERLWQLLWPADQLPARYATSRDGVHAAEAHQDGGRVRVGTA